MHDVELYARARDTYIKTGNLSKTLKYLKTNGYVISYTTLRRWKNESEGEWDQAKSEYVKSLSELSVQVRDLHDQLLVELIEQKEKIRKRLERSSKDEKGLYSQAIFAYDKIINRIMILMKMRQNQDVGKERYITAWMDVLFEEEVIGPELVKRYDSLLKKVDAKLKKNG
jgi:hypothetical protein